MLLRLEKPMDMNSINDIEYPKNCAGWPFCNSTAFRLRAYSPSHQINYTVNTQNMDILLLNLDTQYLLNLANNSADAWWSNWSPEMNADDSSPPTDFQLTCLDT